MFTPLNACIRDKEKIPLQELSKEKMNILSKQKEGNNNVNDISQKSENRKTRKSSLKR